MDAARLRVGRSAPLPAHAERAQDPVRAGLDQAYSEAASAGFNEGLRQGRQEGLAAGQDEGLRVGREEAQRRLEEEVARSVAAATEVLRNETARLQSLLAHAESIVAACSAAAEDELVALCFETVSRIVGEVALRPEQVRATVVAALCAAGEQARIHLHVHPDDAALLQRITPAPVAGQAITWHSDPAVALGGCIVKGARGGLDRRLEILLAGCRDALLGAREARRASAAGAGEAMS